MSSAILPGPFRSGPIRSSSAWPGLVEAGAGLSEAEFEMDEALSAPIERMRPQPFDVVADMRRHPLLYVGLGAMALGLTLYLGRGAMSRPRQA